MDDQKALEVAQLITKDIFGRASPLSLDEMQRTLANDIALPVVLPCVRTGQPVHIHNPQPNQKVISEEASMQEAMKDDWMMPKRSLTTIEEFLTAWNEVNFMRGDKHMESMNVTKSDSVGSSQNVYMSTLIISSKNIVLSHNNSFSNYLLACDGNNACNFGIRIFDSLYCSSSYEVRWSNKVSKSMFITDSLDLYECIACFGLRSKKYCIGNMQYEKEEYMKIKAMIIDWIFEQWQKG